jgi:hypothetical protein
MSTSKSQVIHYSFGFSARYDIVAYSIIEQKPYNFGKVVNFIHMYKIKTFKSTIRVSLNFFGSL